MKTRILAGGGGTVRWALAAAGTVLAVLGAPSAPGAEGGPADKPYSLFMGADISVQLGKTACPVRRVSGGSWVVDRDGRAQEVDATHGLQNLKVVSSLKLTEAAALLADFSTEAAFSFANDPITRQTRAFARAADLNIGHSAALNAANASLVQAQKTASYSESASGMASQQLQKLGDLFVFWTPANYPGDVRVNNEAETDYETITTSGTDNELYGDHGQGARMDALRVRFAISSPRPIRDPYIVTIARFRERTGVPGRTRNLVYARALGPIDQNPQRVEFLEEGYTPGFEIVDLQVHLYSGGVEVATNKASKRVDFSRDEALAYLRIGYLGNHRNESRPPEPALGRLPGDFAGRLASGRYRATYFVRVSKDGVGEGVFEDASCSRRVNDDEVESIVRNLSFMPALEKGQATEGVLALRLDQLKF
jgi:hypothetical protein